MLCISDTVPNMIEIHVMILQCDGGGPGPVVKTVYLESRRSWVRPSLWNSRFNETEVSSTLIRKDIVLWRASETKFQILCLDDSVI